jgi:(1->4)-alpha-D-glucan 1-alpha-D-glucosylmutase
MPEEPFVALVAKLGERIALEQTLLKLTCPGVPDIYQGDEFESLDLVDPDNRRPVDWEARRRALDDPPPKQRVIREALALRAARPEVFAGSYEPEDAGSGVCAFTRGGAVRVAVRLRRRARVYVPARGWREVVPGLYVRN